MQVTPSRTFIYGDFSAMTAVTEGRTHAQPIGRPEIAVEILREFSPTELVGKVYAKGRNGNWGPVSQSGLKDFVWYKDKEFTKNKRLAFWMDGSKPWEVLYFRPESDDAGPYVAVGLRLSHSD